LIRTYIDLASYYLRSRVLGRRLPFLCSFKLTYRCNLKCEGCPFHQRQDSGGDIPYEKALSVLRLLRRRGNRVVIFEGGEPAMYSDRERMLADLVREAKRMFLCVGATTNGTLGLDIPTDVLWVSVDGLRQTHNRLRCDSFDRVVENIRASKHPYLLAHVTLNRQNAGELTELIPFLCGLETIKGVTCQFHYPYDGSGDELTLSPADRERAVETLVRLKSKGYPVFNSVPALREHARFPHRHCLEFLLDNVNPDGTISQGCYLRSRQGTVECDLCGFTPNTEATLAYRGRPASLAAGYRIFLAGLARSRRAGGR